MSVPSSWSAGGPKGPWLSATPLSGNRAFPGTFKVPKGLVLDIELCRDDLCFANVGEKEEVGPEVAADVGLSGESR